MSLPHREFATKADLQKLKADLVKWIFGRLVSQLMVVLGGVWFMLSQTAR